MARQTTSLPLPKSLLPAELAPLSPGELSERGRATVVLIERSHFDLARLLAHVEKQPRRHGYSSAIDYAEAELGIREREAYHLLKLERDTRPLPELRAAWANGDVPFSNAREVAKVAKPEDEARWTKLARTLPYRAVYARVHGEGEAKAEAGKAPWPDTGLHGKIGQGEKVFQEPRPLTRSLKDLEREVFELHNRSAGRDTSWREFFEAALTAYRLDLEREHGQVAADVRRILDRDGWRCQVPGCSRRYGLERDHTRARSLGGDDRAELLVTLCSSHHGARHAGLVEITGDARKGFRFRHRETPGGAWREYPKGAAAGYDPRERAWDGPSYVKESSAFGLEPARAFNSDVTRCRTTSLDLGGASFVRAGPI